MQVLIFGLPSTIITQSVHLMNAEELALVESWDEKYCSGIGMLAMDILGLEGR